MRFRQLCAIVAGGVLALTACAGGGVIEVERGAAVEEPRAQGDRSPGPRTPRRPNIVVVMADDMRADEVAYAPTVRRVLGRHGLEFTHSFSPYPLCCPARASFLTGQYAHNHGVLWHQAPYGYAAFDDSATIATSLSARGYRTGFIGKYLNGYGVMPSKVSGEPSHDYVPSGWDDWRATFENPRTLPGVTGGAYDYFDTPFNVNGEIVSQPGRYQSDVIGDLSVDMARGFSRGDAPFFMYVSYVAPHHGGPVEVDDPGAVLDTDGDVVDGVPLQPLTDDRGEEALLRTPARPERVKGMWDELIDGPAGLPRDGGPAERDVSDKPAVMERLVEPNRSERAAMTALTRQRAEAISVMDQQIRRLVRQLRRSGEWKDTVLMFTSDNGYFLGEHRMRSGKVHSHEPSLRVPFLVTGPGMRSGEQRHDPITTVDVTASILDLAGAPAPVVADGASRVSTMLAGDRGWDVPVVTESMHTSQGKQRGMRKFGAIGLRTPRHSYTRYRGDVVELYDLVEDPQQNHNVAGDPAYARTERQLRRTWRQCRLCRGAECRDSMPRLLRAGPDELARISGDYRQAIERVHGFG